MTTKNATTREEKYTAYKTTEADRAAVVAAYKTTDNSADCVASLISAIGYDCAMRAISELVNGINGRDARVSNACHKWAETIEEAATPAELAQMGIYSPSEIHPTNIQLIARAAREAVRPEEPTAEEATAEEATAEEATAEEATADGKYIHHSHYFCGNKISDYGIENGYIDYATLARSFKSVLNNGIMGILENSGFYFELENGSYMFYEDENGNYISESEYEELTAEEQNKYNEYYREFYQYYIVSDLGADILKEYTNEAVWYNADCDMYIWGVSHFGTSWDYVLTDIKIEME